MTRYLVERGDSDTWWVEASNFYTIDMGGGWVIFVDDADVEVARFKYDTVTAIIPEDKS